MRKTEAYNLPAPWAPYLINGDESGWEPPKRQRSTTGWKSSGSDHALTALPSRAFRGTTTDPTPIWVVTC